MKNQDVIGSASANYLMCVYKDYNSSFLDCLHAVDRNTTSGLAQYHSLSVSLRRAFIAGLSFDFNYTWSHSLDLGSAAESGAGQEGAAIKNIFNIRDSAPLSTSICGTISLPISSASSRSEKTSRSSIA